MIHVRCWHHSVVLLLLVLITAPQARADDRDAPPAAQQRPRIGVAFGGGSARGLAHVGVIRWFEEHHVPIDLIAGTSMGGPVGGAYASGLSSQDLSALLAPVAWDEPFHSTPPRPNTVRRTAPARHLPSPIPPRPHPR